MLVVNSDTFSMRGKIDYPMPPKGALAFVEKILDAACGVKVHELDPSWVPIGILGTLDWVSCATWWFFHYGSVRLTDENTRNIWLHKGEHEWDPEQLLVFRWDESNNSFDERWDHMGLTTLEKGEVIQFVKEVIFEEFKKEEGIEVPQRSTIERITWATFMWLLSENGTDWCCEKDPILWCAQDFGETFLTLWDDPDGEHGDTSLLDPRNMQDTKRAVGTCKSCGENLWCVSGFSLYNKTWTKVTDSEEDDAGWYHLCHACVTEINDAGGCENEFNPVFAAPSCGKAMCQNTGCPHMQVFTDNFNRTTNLRLVEAGRRKVEKYKQLVTSGGSFLPGSRDIVEHFRGGRELPYHE